MHCNVAAELINASFMKGKLPAFKVTQRLRGGLTVHRNVPRGRSIQATSDPDGASDSEAEEICDSHSDEAAMLESTVDVHLDCLGRDVSLHAVKEQASANAWGKIRPVLRRAVVESSAMPTIQLCTMYAETAMYMYIGAVNVVQMLTTAITASIKHTVHFSYWRNLAGIYHLSSLRTAVVMFLIGSLMSIPSITALQRHQFLCVVLTAMASSHTQIT